MQVKDKVAVITGGASGLGAATARYFTEQGAKVSVFDLNEEAGQALCDELGPDRAIFHAVDVCDDKQVADAVKATVDSFGTIHININAAGIPAPTKILDREGSPCDLGKFAKVININLIGLFNAMSKCVAVMAKNDPENGEERGVVVNVSSGAAYEGQIGQAGYSASKAGVIGLNIPAARELGAVGVRVNAIAPGLFGTPLVMGLGDKVVSSLVETVEAPRRMGDMREFAHTCRYIVENAYLNGETIRLDAATRLKAK
ncbi:MAG: SDR family NAD(P)-dependent oxidoreductase [Sphingomonadaceae bacterium]|nr:SDR family NAD(P)-dependent oxidoreductase [Sphingomonadaceae bacterium]